MSKHDRPKVRPVPPSGTTDPKLSMLERRLNDGYQRIEQAREIGQDVQAWEEFWIELLRQYEQDSAMLPEAQP